MSTKRTSAVAGRFYPASAAALKMEILAHLKGAGDKVQPLGAISPHAGIMYSGSCAGRLIGALDHIPDTLVILGPNHTGMGKAIAVDPHDEWETPLGSAFVDGELRRALLEIGRGWISEDAAAHRREHSIEVQLPFFQVRRSDLRFLPVCLGFADYDVAVALGHALMEALRQCGRDDFLLLASSDMSHFLPQSRAEKMDRLALDPFLALDPRRAWDTIRSHDISMCGFVPAVTVLSACLKAGASRAKLIHYTTSMEASGDASSVVGYASMVFLP